MEKIDIIRYSTVNNLLKEGKTASNKISLTVNEDDKGFYTEILPINEIRGNVSEYISDFIDNKVDLVLEEFGYYVDYDNLVLESSDLYDGHQVRVPIKRSRRDMMEDFFKEVDEAINQPQPQAPAAQPQTPPVQQPAPQQATVAPAAQGQGNANAASNIPLTKEPKQHQIGNLPVGVKQRKTQNPKKVDLVLKTTFESKFNKYTLRTDAENWKPMKKPEPNGKLFIVWENKDAPSVKIETLLFPNDTNKIEIFVKDTQGTVLIKTFLEIYRIPTNEFIVEKFFRKTFFNLLKKFIDTKVILLEPFRTKYVFWKSDNPTYAYSFSSPNKNKIILDLISFINTAKKPILDDFFEQNNLKHKQGYLQTLLDSSEAAGIFRFKREGNEIIILRGPNYKFFLEGKVRRVLQ